MNLLTSVYFSMLQINDECSTLRIAFNSAPVLILGFKKKS